MLTGRILVSQRNDCGDNHKETVSGQVGIYGGVAFGNQPNMQKGTTYVVRS